MDKMDGEQKGWAWLVACMTIVLVVLITSLVYYNLEQDKLPLLLVEKGINPAVARCIDISWTITGNYIICSKVLSGEKITKQEAEKLMKGLR